MASMVVSSTGDRFRHDVAVREFALTVDEPVELGGTNEGPTPTELVFSGLGSCKAITLKMYADRKGWPLAAVDAEIWVEQVERRYRVRVQLKLVGELSEAQQQRLLEISNRCPVHKLLADSVEIETVLK